MTFFGHADLWRIWSILPDNLCVHLLFQEFFGCLLALEIPYEFMNDCFSIGAKIAFEILIRILYICRPHPLQGKRGVLTTALLGNWPLLHSWTRELMSFTRNMLVQLITAFLSFFWSQVFMWLSSKMFMWIYVKMWAEMMHTSSGSI